MGTFDSAYGKRHRRCEGSYRTFNPTNRSLHIMVMVSSQAFSPDEHSPAHSSQPSKANTKVHTTINTTRIPTEGEFSFRNLDSLKFVMQIVITFFMLMLCWNGLHHENDNTRALYWGGLTGIIGWWMPSPGSFKGNSDSDSKKS